VYHDASTTSGFRLKSGEELMAVRSKFAADLKQKPPLDE
jgi:hypothetical protein